MFHLFHTYVAEVLHVATLAAQEAGACEGSPRGYARSEAGVGGPHLHTQQQVGVCSSMRGSWGRHNNMRNRRSRRGCPRGHAGSEAVVGGPHLHTQQHVYAQPYAGQLGQVQQHAGRTQQAEASG
jgi:hypothetical protein